MEEPVHPVNIPRREKDFQGMLEYKKEDELKLIKNLILGKKQTVSWEKISLMIFLSSSHH